MGDFKLMKKKKHFEWLQKCLVCWEASENLISECIKEQKNINILNIARDCAEICSLCIKFEAQRSGFFEQLCQVGANICDACADECERSADRTKAVEKCAEVCRICSEACRATAADSGFQQSTA